MITITIDSSAIHRALSQLSGQLDDMTPVMLKIAETMAAAIEENFDSEGARLGARWKPSRRAIKQGDKTLQDTERLAGSMVTRVTRNSAEVGTNVEYGPIHQFGGTIRQNAQSRLQGFKVNKKTGQSRFAKRGKANFEQWTSRGAYTINMPKRPFLGLNADDERAIVDTIQTALARDLKT